MDERQVLTSEVGEAHAVVMRFLAHEECRSILDSALTMAQLRLLLLLAIHGPLGGNDLATHLGVSLPSVSGMVDRLETRELVERRPDPRDRRVRLVALSATGTALLAEHEAAGREFGQELLADIDLDGLRALARGLTALSGAVVRRAAQRGGPEPTRETATEAGDEPAITAGAARR